MRRHHSKIKTGAECSCGWSTNVSNGRKAEALRVDHEATEDHACPTCKALPGALCRTKKGEVMVWCHPARRRLVP